LQILFLLTILTLAPSIMIMLEFGDLGGLGRPIWVPPRYYRPNGFKCFE
jgi:hypothetical protein